MFKGVDLTGLRNTQSSAMTWDFFKRMRDATKMKILLKGILAWEDAVMAADAGIDGIIVSNHGARSEDSGRSTIDALPEIVEAVKGRMPILVDSGFRRGSDIVKALCMGATAVCVGRPYIWGLGAFGQPGVERVLELLRDRNPRHDAADGRADRQAPGSSDGAAGLSEATRACATEGSRQTGALHLPSPKLEPFHACIAFCRPDRGRAVLRQRRGADHRPHQRHPDRRHRRAARRPASPS